VLLSTKVIVHVGAIEWIKRSGRMACSDETKFILSSACLGSLRYTQMLTLDWTVSWFPVSQPTMESYIIIIFTHAVFACNIDKEGIATED
jgi:hypothetical protein